MSAARAICSGVAVEPRIGTMIQPIPSSCAIRSWPTYLKSVRLIAVSERTVRIFSRRIRLRRVSGRCQAPRKIWPGVTTANRFSPSSVQKKRHRAATTIEAAPMSLPLLNRCQGVVNITVIEPVQSL